MPYDEPEFDDPHELHGVGLPGDETITYEMAAAFAEEFAQLGYTRPQILALFRKAEYAGAHQAWTLLGEEVIAQLVDESVGVWGRFTCVVTDSPVNNADKAEDAVTKPLRLVRSRS